MKKSTENVIVHFNHVDEILKSSFELKQNILKFQSNFKIVKQNPNHEKMD